jgi:hypothetical protein
MSPPLGLIIPYCFKIRLRASEHTRTGHQSFTLRPHARSIEHALAWGLHCQPLKGPVVSEVCEHGNDRRSGLQVGREYLACEPAEALVVARSVASQAEVQRACFDLR